MVDEVRGKRGAHFCRVLQAMWGHFKVRLRKRVRHIDQPLLSKKENRKWETSEEPRDGTFLMFRR